MIEVENLSKRYGDKLAVDGLSFTVQPGIVTGFLGPNGAGKSTTMRMIAGLDEPTSGQVRVNGKDYRECRGTDGRTRDLARGEGRPHRPLGRQPPARPRPDQRHQQAPRRRGDRHGRACGKSQASASAGSPSAWANDSGSASALLGDPSVVVLDEPVNGLDPEGVLWIRTTADGTRREGRTVFVSSHLMSEMAVTATRLVVVGRGRLIADTTVDEFIARASGNTVTVRTPAAAELRDLLLGPDVTVTSERDRRPARARPHRRADRPHRLAGTAAHLRTLTPARIT